MLTKALALDWAKRGVRVNTLAPGWVDTDLTHGLLEHDVHGKRLLDHTPMGRFATRATWWARRCFWPPMRRPI